MTLKIYDYELGTTNAAITAANSGGLNPVLETGTATFTSIDPYQGALSARYAYTSGGVSGVWQRFAPAATNANLSSRIAFKISGLTGNSQSAVVLWRASSGPLYNLRIISVSGVLTAHIYSPGGGTNLVVTLGNISANTWYSFTSVVNGSTGAYTFKLYTRSGVLVGSTRTGTDSTLIGTVAFMQVGQSSVENLDIQVDIDNVSFDDGSLTEIAATSLSVAAFTPILTEPEIPVSMTATLSGGQTADSYSWQRVSGPMVQLQTAGNTCTFTAPSVMPPGVQLQIGVTATKDGVTSAQRIQLITIQPQLSWYYHNGAWIGKRPSQLLGS